MTLDRLRSTASSVRGFGARILYLPIGFVGLVAAVVLLVAAVLVDVVYLIAVNIVEGVRGTERIADQPVATPAVFAFLTHVLENFQWAIHGRGEFDRTVGMSGRWRR